MSETDGNIFAKLEPASSGEAFTDLLKAPPLRIERIVSTGQATALGEWLEQDRSEWVILLRGSAGLLFEGEAQPHRLQAGDYVNIPAHRRHRVEWTAPNEPTIWLAVHYDT